MSEIFKIVSSQYKHLPGRGAEEIAPRVITQGSLLRNEPFSFQTLYRAPSGNFCLSVSIGAETELPIEAWRVDYVAAMNAANPCGEPGYESDRPGLFPDILMPRPAKPTLAPITVGWQDSRFCEEGVDHLLNATDSDFQSVWFTVNPDSRVLAAGNYEICLRMTNLKDGSLMAEETLTLTVVDALLPEHDSYYTNWFHVDCVCDLFGVKPYTNAFYRLFDEYIRNMVRHRQTMLLIPAFTPPLDTLIGAERMNVQLVDVEQTADGWRFGFEKMRRYIRHAKKCGIRYFEHCHIYSQWGAKHTPNIYNTAGKRLFGFETDAVSPEYRAFIRAYLEAFLAFAEKEGIRDRLVFHISDEPVLDHLENYRAAHNQVADLLEGFPVADAMSHVEFYEAGLVNNPVAMVKYAERFDGKCPNFWLYYTGGTYEHCCSNRLVSNTAALTRVLGVQLYRYRSPGFLQWAYNYYYDFRSLGCCDPKVAPNTYRMYPGVTYLCYPIMGRVPYHVVPSLREKLMAEAFDDLRALKLLESLVGREETLSLCESVLGEPVTYHTIPEGDTLRTLREQVNDRIASVLSK